MTDNRSLDEFAGTAEEADEDRPADVDGGSAARPASEPAGAAPDPEPGSDDPVPADVERPDANNGAEADGDASDAGPETAAVEPVASTYAWSPDGGECAACGATVEERWRDGDDLVCLDCKEW